MYSFLEVKTKDASFDEALFHIIPVAFESSLSLNGRGTARGPEAIIKASQKLELYDGVSTSASDAGIHTVSAMECCSGAERILASTQRLVSSSIKKDKIPIIIGGEHTVTIGAVDALKELHEDFGIIQFDAHADLRDNFEGTRLSHACVMRRVHERDVPFYQVGVRSLSSEEAEFRKENGIPHLDAREIYASNKKELVLPDNFPKKVYVTIDIDVMDPSVVSSIVTPVPGGILWYDMLHFLQTISENFEVIGFDCVELAPTGSDHASPFAATQLIYNFMGMIARSSGY